jgi:hypothetical protein
MAYYNMILTEAIFQLLEEKGLPGPTQNRNQDHPSRIDTEIAFLVEKRCAKES